ncbi:MAG: hypothetical protein U0169_08170 [Polyangiaceae bacterium]
MAASVPTFLVGVVTSRAAEAEATRTREAAREARTVPRADHRDLGGLDGTRTRRRVRAAQGRGSAGTRTGPRALEGPFRRRLRDGRDGHARRTDDDAPAASGYSGLPGRARGARDRGPREGSRATILASCPDLRSDAGRFLFPLLALESVSGESPPRDGATVVPWLRGHGAELGAAEREVLGKRVEALGVAEREEARRALRVPPSVGDAIRAVLDGARAPALGGGGDRPSSTASHGLVIGRTEDDGARVGFVVHEGSLAALKDASETRTDLRGHALLPGPGNEGAIVRVTPSFVMHVVDADPSATEARACGQVHGASSSARRPRSSCPSAWWRSSSPGRRAERLAELRTDFVAAVSPTNCAPPSPPRGCSPSSSNRDPCRRTNARRSNARSRGRRVASRARSIACSGSGRSPEDKLTAVLAPADARELLEGAATRARAAHPDVGITLDCPPGLALLVDADLLGLAVDNLLSNAAKYAAEGGPFVVRAIREGNDVVISVADRGPGLDAKARPASSIRSRGSTHVSRRPPRARASALPGSRHRTSPRRR